MTDKHNDCGNDDNGEAMTFTDRLDNTEHSTMKDIPNLKPIKCKQCGRTVPDFGRCICEAMECGQSEESGADEH